MVTPQTSPPQVNESERASEPQVRVTSQVAPTATLAGKRVAAVVFSAYPADPRPRRAAEALVREGVQIEVICLRQSEDEPTRESFQGVEITRIPMKRRRGGALTYLLQYGLFVLSSAMILACRTLRHRYDLVHVHNMPDFLVFSAVVPKLLGTRVILDLHDPMPELMMAIFGLQENSSSIRLLKMIERWSIRFADSAITVSETFRKIFAARSCSPEKVAVIMNSPDQDIFRFCPADREKLRERDGSRPFVIMYHGSLVERHGLDLAVEALGKVREMIPHAELRIYGRSTPFLESVLNFVQKSPLKPAIRYCGPKTLEEIAEAIKACDVGVIPNRKSLFTELNTPTRIFEYLSQGKPVIAPRSAGILEYFNEDSLHFFDLGCSEGIASAIRDIYFHPEETIRMVERGQEVYRAHIWPQERARFVGLVNNILAGKSCQ